MQLTLVLSSTWVSLYDQYRLDSQRLTAWIGYTLSWTWRKFPDLNDGNKYTAKYDRLHDFAVVGIYELSPKWKLSSTFIFGTSNAISLIKPDRDLRLPSRT